MSELLPCPFCNGNAVIERMGSGRVSMIYTCEDCGCRLETGETFLNPYCSWNTRHSPSPAPVTVSEEQIEAACAAWCKQINRSYSATLDFHSPLRPDDNMRKTMRAALEAALTTNKKG